MSAKPYLQLSEINQYFGSFQALKSVSLAINEGEFVCFLGPSGCGKTTLLRIIAGLETLSQGNITQAGRDITYAPVTDRDFGIVFQSYALFPNLTVAQNIAYGLKSKRFSKAEQAKRVSDLLETVGLSGSEEKYPAQLSGGQQQRVALARALTTSPGLLLLDEPLSALDARVRAHLRHEIKQLQVKLGVTTIMVTHDQEEAMTMADRIVVMNHGCIEQIGTPEEIYSQPATPFVANFVGEMNFFNGQVSEGQIIKSGSLSLEYPESKRLDQTAPVQVAVRPEDIRMQLNGDRHNVISATVEDLEFMGSKVRSHLLVADHPEPIIADVSMNEMAELKLQAGQNVELQLPKERLHLFSELS